MHPCVIKYIIFICIFNSKILKNFHGRLLSIFFFFFLHFLTSYIVVFPEIFGPIMTCVQATLYIEHA